jgi:hypothetical protein
VKKEERSNVRIVCVRAPCDVLSREQRAQPTFTGFPSHCVKKKGADWRKENKEDLTAESNSSNKKERESCEHYSTHTAFLSTRWAAQPV